VSGYDEESRCLLDSLRLTGLSVWEECLDLVLDDRDGEPGHVDPIPDGQDILQIIHFPWTTFRTHPRAIRTAWRTTFETDRLPPHMLEKTKEVNRIWVPSRFNFDTFCAAGVNPHKIRVVPPSLDTHAFRSARAEPSPASQTEFVFLSVFRWQQRKGWDVLVQAFAREFGRRDDVRLVLQVAPFSTRDPLKPARQLAEFVAANNLPTYRPISLRTQTLQASDLRRLYASANAFVLPSRGEGWGRPYMEAMAMGVLTIGTNWGGQLDYMSADNALLIDSVLSPVSDVAVQEWPNFGGHRWAEPSVDHLRALMRAAYEGHIDHERLTTNAANTVMTTYGTQVVATQLKQAVLDLMLADREVV
jgi:glycosyltransferase involved in cell wall biosynthesis